MAQENFITRSEIDDRDISIVKKMDFIVDRGIEKWDSKAESRMNQLIQHADACEKRMTANVEFVKKNKWWSVIGVNTLVAFAAGGVILNIGFVQDFLKSLILQ